MIQKNYFSGNQKLKTEFITPDGEMKGDTRYSKDGRFEYRMELCNTSVTFEGILFNGKFCGLSTWAHCNGLLSEQGTRYKNRQIGVWNRWDEAGKLFETVDHGFIFLMDSIDAIR
jgi:antitoxin component YwqK of YwqJK toxin-antitoxin module